MNLTHKKKNHHGGIVLFSDLDDPGIRATSFWGCHMAGTNRSKFIWKLDTLEIQQRAAGHGRDHSLLLVT